jgi:hypothetical protein
MYAHPTSEHPRRAAFATKNLWVTPHSDDERFPAGDYCMRVGDNSGLLAWTALVRPAAPAGHLARPFVVASLRKCGCSRAACCACLRGRARGRPSAAAPDVRRAARQACALRRADASAAGR